MLYTLVSEINKQLASLFEQYTGSKLYDGLAKTISRDGKSMPAIASKDGDAKYVGLDDNTPLSIYHKLISLGITERAGAYGDQIAFKVYTYGMQMILFIDEKKVCHASDFVLKIQANLEKITLKPFRQILVRLTAANFNTAQVFVQEYPGNTPSLRLQQNLIAITYQIEATINPACLPVC